MGGRRGGEERRGGRKEGGGGRVKKRDITEKPKKKISTDLTSQPWEHVMSETNQNRTAENFPHSV